MFFLAASAWIVAIAMLVPALVLLAEVLASLRAPRRLKLSDKLPATAVVVPAHNEGRHIIPTLKDLQSAAWPQTRIIVVADNCDDDTAEIAASCGAEVVERREPERRGKGYALQYAINFLRKDPPDFVAFFDADCRLEDGALERVVRAAAAVERPVQAIYEMAAGENLSPRARIAQFAWAFMNVARMRGLNALGGVTRFTGVGLAAPWAALSDFTFGSGAITEDHALTFALAERRRAPMLESSARVFSRFPETDEAMVIQRARWERGSLGVLVRRGLGGVLKSVSSGNRQLFAISCDALTPPLVLFAALLAMALLFCGAVALVGPDAPFIATLSAAAGFAISLSIGWVWYGRDILPASSFGAMIPFVLDKAKIYGRQGRETTKSWSRTERSDKT
jgi:cellulose synthase/poly-beta-1,6-N-acetylglucosamine synthase-like glycosyltransferase